MNFQLNCSILNKTAVPTLVLRTLRLQYIAKSWAWDPEEAQSMGDGWDVRDGDSVCDTSTHPGQEYLPQCHSTRCYLIPGMQECVRERDEPDGHGFPLPLHLAGAQKKTAGTCHRQRQNGNTQGQAAWGEAGWHLLDARRGRTGASPSEGGCCWRGPGWGPHCWATHMLASWQLSSNRATTAKHSVPWQHKGEVLQDVEIKDLSTLLPLPF